MESTFLDTKTAAELLGLSSGTLENWRLQGVGPQWRKHGGHRVVYLRDDLLAWSDKQRRTSTSDRRPRAK
jgi:Helix-turn-helix domain